MHPGNVPYPCCRFAQDRWKVILHHTQKGDRSVLEQSRIVTPCRPRRHPMLHSMGHHDPMSHVQNPADYWNEEPDRADQDLSTRNRGLEREQKRIPDRKISRKINCGAWMHLSWLTGLRPQIAVEHVREKVREWCGHARHFRQGLRAVEFGFAQGTAAQSRGQVAGAIPGGRPVPASERADGGGVWEPGAAVSRSPAPGRGGAAPDGGLPGRSQQADFSRPRVKCCSFSALQ